jgi:hypothetical protein
MFFKNKKKILLFLCFISLSIIKYVKYSYKSLKKPKNKPKKPKNKPKKPKNKPKKA